MYTFTAQGMHLCFLCFDNQFSQRRRQAIERGVGKRVLHTCVLFLKFFLIKKIFFSYPCVLLLLRVLGCGQDTRVRGSFYFIFIFFSSTTLLLPTHFPPPSCTHAQSCNPMDCSPPGSSVQTLFQARILEWVAISFSKGLFLK